MLKLLLSEPTPDEGEEQDENSLMVHMNKYWPYPMDISDPQNDNLLLLGNFGPFGDEFCELCTVVSDKCIELQPIVRLNFICCYSDVYGYQEVPPQGVEEAIKRFKAWMTDQLKRSPFFSEPAANQRLEEYPARYFRTDSTGRRIIPNNYVDNQTGT